MGCRLSRIASANIVQQRSNKLKQNKTENRETHHKRPWLSTLSFCRNWITDLRCPKPPDNCAPLTVSVTPSYPRPESSPKGAWGQTPRPRTLPVAELAPITVGDPLPRVRIGPDLGRWPPRVTHPPPQGGGRQATEPRTCRSRHMFPQLPSRSLVVG